MSDRWFRRELKLGKAGRLEINLSRDAKKFHRFVHRLVLEAFVGPCPNGMECCHGDGDAGNNNLANLRWDTRSANRADSVRHGTANLWLPGRRAGEKNGRAKLTLRQVEQIAELRRDEGIGAAPICDRLGIPRTHLGAVNQVVRGKNWRHVTGLPAPR